MVLENKLQVTDSLTLSRLEEQISKRKAVKMFDSGFLDTLPPGTWDSLAKIHSDLFCDIYPFAGQLRTVNLAKGNFCFAPVMYLESALQSIDKMPQDTFAQMIEKYVEMNVAHPFREGNGRAARIWLDVMLKKQLHRVIDWSRVEKDDYLSAMERSPVEDFAIKRVLQAALVEDTGSRELFMKGIDSSYQYEGCSAFRTAELAEPSASRL